MKLNNMRFSEFEGQAKNIQFIKFSFDKVLNTLIADYEKKLKSYKAVQTTAKKKFKNKRIKAHKSKSTLSAALASRPKR